MARSGRKITCAEKDFDRIPDFLGEGVALVLDLLRRGVLAQVGERLHIRREGGYSGFDVVLFFLFYFSATRAVGIRKFWEGIRPYGKKLAATAERKRLATPSSLSRALDAVEPDLIRPVSPWLLSEGAGIDVVLEHPAVQTYDATGRGWHVFDFDPTVTTLRQRALPEGDDLPTAMRRAKRTAKAGYPGRKRGDVQFRRGTLQHLGSSAWLHATLAPGNGEAHGELREALSVVVQTSVRLGHPLDHVLLRIDGAFGWVPFLWDCREYSVPFLTRLTRAELFEQPEILRALREGTWRFVPDSLSGPRRSAMELGSITLAAGERTKRADGTAYDPITVRVIVSRYPEGKKKDRTGFALDGWQYEMFVIDAPEDAFSAAEAVALYFGRAAQENRFAQEDREAGLDRIYSYHLPGQELVVVVGLWMWNLRLVRGFELAIPPRVRPAQFARVLEVDHRVIEPTAPTPGPQATPLCSTTSELLPTPPEPRTPAEDLLEELGRIDWDLALRNRPGWSMDRAIGRLRCVDGRELALTTVRSVAHRRGITGLIFCRPIGGCETCGPRSSCLRSLRDGASKHFEVSVPSANAARLREILRAARRGAPPVPGEAGESMSPQQAAAASPDLPPGTDVTELAVASSLFLPARARQLFRYEASSLSVTVFVKEPERKPPKPELLAESVADRQHRRKTWRENYARNAIDPETEVLIEVSGGARLRGMFGDELAKMSA
jgi:hypothetical protein